MVHRTLEIVWMGDQFALWFFFKGMEEIGVYRISGVTSEIQRIKKAFDKSKTFILYKVYIYQTKHSSLGISSSLVGLLPVFTFK